VKPDRIDEKIEKVMTRPTRQVDPVTRLQPVDFFFVFLLKQRRFEFFLKYKLTRLGNTARSPSSSGHHILPLLLRIISSICILIMYKVKEKKNYKLVSLTYNQ
jgi:hypothetical protein